MCFLLHTSGSGLEINNSKKYFLSYFYVNSSIAIKYSELIWEMIVLSKNEQSCFKISLGTSFLSINGGERGRGQIIKQG